MRPDDITRATEPVFAHNPWLQVYLDDVVVGGLPSQRLRLVESGGVPGVVILPLRGAHVGMVRQYRVVLGEDVWELPRGFGEAADPVQDASRELAEETGLAAASWVSLGTVLPNSGLSAGAVRLFLARVGQTRDLDAMDDEVDTFAWWPVSRLRAAIEADEIRDGFTLAAFLRADLRGLLPKD
ncbi:NUDIX hydrolase [Streptomyces sp. NPDC014864]|uniref:NUDIX hydrolase n=1 Tax=Streptomyces sp. NPDC014864 TaxID=3364924 RepID=UPI0036F4BEB0